MTLLDDDRPSIAVQTPEPMPFAAADVAPLIAIFLLGFLFLLALRTVSSRNDAADHEPFIETTFECRECGEELEDDRDACPVCGGEVERIETPVE